MQITINRSREVDLESEQIGTVGENDVEKLEFIFPDGFDNFYKTIEIEAGNTKSVDEIENDVYYVSRALTQFKKIKAQIVIKDLENDIVFKSEVFNLKTKKSLNVIEELDSKNRTLIDSLILRIQQTNEEIQNLYNNLDDLEARVESQEEDITRLETAVVDANYINRKDKTDISRWNNKRF